MTAEREPLAPDWRSRRAIYHQALASVECETPKLCLQWAGRCGQCRRDALVRALLREEWLKEGLT